MQIILKRIQCWNAFWNSKAYMALSVPLCHALHLHSYHISMISYPFIATGRCINSSSRNDTEKQSMSLELRMRFFNVHKCMRYVTIGRRNDSRETFLFSFLNSNAISVTTIIQMTTDTQTDGIKNRIFLLANWN